MTLISNNQQLYFELISLLKEKQMSQSELSRLLGTSRSNVSIILKGLSKDKNINSNTLFKILNILNKKIHITDN